MVIMKWFIQFFCLLFVFRLSRVYAEKNLKFLFQDREKLKRKTLHFLGELLRYKMQYDINRPYIWYYAVKTLLNNLIT